MTKRIKIYLLGLFLTAAANAADPAQRIKVIECDYGVSVFADRRPDIGVTLKVDIEFPTSNGHAGRDVGELIVHFASMEAKSSSIYVYGDLQGHGYFALLGWSKPKMAHCTSIPIPPSGSSVGN